MFECAFPVKNNKLMFAPCATRDLHLHVFQQVWKRLVGWLWSGERRSATWLAVLQQCEECHSGAGSRRGGSCLPFSQQQNLPPDVHAQLTLSPKRSEYQSENIHIWLIIVLVNFFFPNVWNSLFKIFSSAAQCGWDEFTSSHWFVFLWGNMNIINRTISFAQTARVQYIQLHLIYVSIFTRFSKNILSLCILFI